MTTTPTHGGLPPGRRSKDKQPRPNDAGVAESGPQVPISTQSAPRPKQQRRPMLIALGIATMVVGALGAAWLVSSLSNTTSVVALSADVDRGQVITADALTTTDIAGGQGLDVVPADELEDYVGQRASRDLSAGSVLTSGSATSEVVPAEGQALVGVALTPAQLPNSDLRPGDAVRLVNTPGEGEPFQSGGEISTIAATVVSVEYLDDLGQYVVDLTIAEDRAQEIAALAATRRVALIVDNNTDSSTGSNAGSDDDAQEPSEETPGDSSDPADEGEG